MVDIRMLKSFIDQVQLRCLMLAFEQKSLGDENKNSSCYFKRTTLNELSKTDPNKVENMLEEDN